MVSDVDGIKVGLKRTALSIHRISLPLAFALSHFLSTQHSSSLTMVAFKTLSTAVATVVLGAVSVQANHWVNLFTANYPCSS